MISEELKTTCLNEKDIKIGESYILYSMELLKGGKCTDTFISKKVICTKIEKSDLGIKFIFKVIDSDLEYKCFEVMNTITWFLRRAL